MISGPALGALARGLNMRIPTLTTGINLVLAPMRERLAQVYSIETKIGWPKHRTCTIYWRPEIASAHLFGGHKDEIIWEEGDCLVS